MKRYSVPCRLAVSIAVVCLWVTPLAAFPGGSGTLQDPYWIESASDWSDLVLYQSYWSQHFKLTANIDLSGVSSARVATKDIRFTGSLDGQGHTLSNFTFDQITFNYVGLFAYVGTAGQIRNVNIQGASVRGYYYVGALAGHNDGTITNCYASGIIRGSNVGGLVGVNAGSITHSFAQGTVGAGINATIAMGGLVGSNTGTITSSSVNSTVSGTGYIGGLVSSNSGTINRCFAEGTVSSISGTEGLGGLVGINQSGAAITESYAKTRVIGGDAAGGLVGLNNGTVEKCFALGQVSGGSKVGGLIGSAYGNVNNSYAHGPVSGNMYVAGFAGWVGSMPSIPTAIDQCYSTGLVSGTGTNPNYLYGLIGFLDYTYLPSPTINRCLWDTTTSGKTQSYGGNGYDTQTMQTKEPVYVSWNNWDFTTIWAIWEGTNYPRLRWQIPKGDIACPDGVDIADFAHLATWWNRVDCGTQNNCEGADLDIDGTVDIDDFVILAADWLAGA